MIDPDIILEQVFDTIDDWHSVFDSLEVGDDRTANEIMGGHAAIASMELHHRYSEFGIDYEGSQVIITLMRSDDPMVAMGDVADKIWDAIWLLEQNGEIRPYSATYSYDGYVGILEY